jgi:hypothetical protein
VNRSFTVGSAPGIIHLFCECGQDGCIARIQLPTAIYEEIREQEGLFLVSHDHEDHEQVIREGETYSIAVHAGERERRSRPLRLEPEAILAKPS